MKTILVPTDYSRQAQNALSYALEIAKETKAEIILFHAFYKTIYTPDTVEIDTMIAAMEAEKCRELEKYAETAKQALCKDFAMQFISTEKVSSEAEALLTQTKSGFHRIELDTALAKKEDVKIRCVARFGLAFDQILIATQLYKADLVIMGMKGKGAFSSVFLGNTTIAVIQDSPVPVLAVPTDVPYKVLKNVVLALNLTLLPSNIALNWLRDFVAVIKSKLQVLHLYQEGSQQEVRDKAYKALDTLDVHLHDITYKVVFKQRDDVAEGLQQYVQEQRSDLLILIPSQHTFLEKLLNKSIVGKLSAQANVPLLSLPSQQKQRVQLLAEEALAEEAAND
ncbi:universal stress protein [Botryobacter ruber]|uniref:universal stress protein n=1 Tax=Botryobacter ruber TaxID=2171629 RepID=UPI000F654F16|nr:universal stress protein [Botryobacter ruber]